MHYNVTALAESWRFIASARISALGLGEVTATRSRKASTMKARVVGPIAANSTMRALDVPSCDSSTLGRLKECRKIGVTNSAAEGAKKTIHQRLTSTTTRQYTISNVPFEHTCRHLFDCPFQILGKR